MLGTRPRLLFPIGEDRGDAAHFGLAVQGNHTARAIGAPVAAAPAAVAPAPPRPGAAAAAPATAAVAAAASAAVAAAAAAAPSVAAPAPAAAAAITAAAPRPLLARLGLVDGQAPPLEFEVVDRL